jgi:hypothetical protein
MKLWRNLHKNNLSAVVTLQEWDVDNYMIIYPKVPGKPFHEICIILKFLFPFSEATGT